MTSSEPHAAPAVQVVWQDDHLLVAEKPAGLLSVPGRGPDGADCLSARVQAAWPEALVVHRLDMSTSGLVLFARHAEAQRALSRAFEVRAVDKRYEAVVAGSPALPAHGAGPDGWATIDMPIAADWPRRPLRVIDPLDGRPSVTRWRPLPARVVPEMPSLDGRIHTRLSLWPITGRTHQLRVHLQAIGHPILGDALYGDAVVHAAAPRLLLHACRLALEHPCGGEALAFESRVPF